MSRHRDPDEVVELSLTELNAPVDSSRCATQDDYEPLPDLAVAAVAHPTAGRGSYVPRRRTPDATVYYPPRRRRRTKNWTALAARSWAVLAGAGGVSMFVTILALTPEVFDTRAGLTPFGQLVLWNAVALCLTMTALNMWLAVRRHTSEEDNQ